MAPIIVGCILIGVLTCVYAYEESTIDGSSIAESNGNNFESERPAVFPNTPADSEIDAFLPCACSSTSTEKYLDYSPIMLRLDE